MPHAVMSAIIGCIYFELLVRLFRRLSARIKVFLQIVSSIVTAGIYVSIVCLTMQTKDQFGIEKSKIVALVVVVVVSVYGIVRVWTNRKHFVFLPDQKKEV